jgi:hypothetical protein
MMKLVTQLVWVPWRPIVRTTFLPRLVIVRVKHGGVVKGLRGFMTRRLKVRRTLLVWDPQPPLTDLAFRALLAPILSGLCYRWRSLYEAGLLVESRSAVGFLQVITEVCHR